MNGYGNGQAEKTCGRVGMSWCWLAGTMRDEFQETTNWGIDPLQRTGPESHLFCGMWVLWGSPCPQAASAADPPECWLLLVVRVESLGGCYHDFFFVLVNEYWWNWASIQRRSYSQAPWVQILLINHVNMSKEFISLGLSLSLIWGQ